MTFRELFYKLKIIPSKVADWDVVKTTISLIAITLLVSSGYWTYSKKEKHDYWTKFSYDSYYNTGKEVFFRACMVNSNIYSELASKRGSPSNPVEICKYDSMQSALEFALGNSDKISFKDYLLTGLPPAIKHREEIQRLAKNIALEKERLNLQTVKTELEKLATK